MARRHEATTPDATLDLVERLASPDVTPAAGTAVALVVDVALSLITKAAARSAATWAGSGGVLAQADNLRERVLHCGDAVELSYVAAMEALAGESGDGVLEERLRTAVEALVDLATQADTTAELAAETSTCCDPAHRADATVAAPALRRGRQVVRSPRRAQPDDDARRPLDLRAAPDDRVRSGVDVARPVRVAGSRCPGASAGDRRSAEDYLKVGAISSVWGWSAPSWRPTPVLHRSYIGVVMAAGAAVARPPQVPRRTRLKTVHSIRPGGHDRRDARRAEHRRRRRHRRALRQHPCTRHGQRAVCWP